jgi:putative Holliday junction resolvase
MAGTQTITTPIVLGFDLGSKSLGVAVRNRLGMIMPLPAWFFPRLEEPALVQYVQSLMQTYQPSRLVFGIPYHANGEPSAQTQWVIGVIARLKLVIPIPITTVDERWTTLEAKERLHELGLNEKQQKDYLDSMSACIILEQDERQPR